MKNKYHRYLKMMGRFLNYPECCINEYIRTIDDKNVRCDGKGLYTCPEHRKLSYDQIWNEVIQRKPYDYEYVLQKATYFKYRCGLIGRKEYVDFQSATKSFSHHN